jgi:tetratricopeptide (TPR) repeat protein
LRIAGAKGIRLWVNGKLAFDSDQQLAWNLGSERVPIALLQGRNELLVKTVANPPLLLSLGDSPLDRATMFAERRLWDEAATLFRDEPQHAFQATNSVWSEFSKIALLVDDEQLYRDQCLQIFERHRRSGDKWGMFYAAHTVSFAPNPVLQEHYEELVRMALGVANLGTDNTNRGHAGKALITAAWASLLTDHFSEAEAHLAELPDLGYIQQLAYPCRAIVAERRSNHAEAVKWLEKSHAHAVQHATAKRFPHWPLTVMLLIQLREAERVVAGATTRSDELITEVQTKAAAAWKSADPLTMAFDHRILVFPVTSQRVSEGDALAARGRRFAELQRWEQAEADFDQAVQLAPKDPAMVAERARYHALRGDPEQAAADFNLSLNLLPEKERWSLGQPTYLHAAAQDAVFDRLAALRPADRNLWINRMIQHMRQGDRQAALADAERVLTYEVNYNPLATVLLFGEAAAFERLRAKATELPDSYHKVLALGLAPTVEPMTAELLATADRVWKETQGNAWDRRALGLAQLRAGYWRDALETLQPTIDSSATWQHAAANWPLLAMAHYHLGEKEQARKRLRQTSLWLDFHEQAMAAGRFDTITAPNHGLIAQEWLLAVVFFSEAKELIEVKTSD